MSTLYSGLDIKVEFSRHYFSRDVFLLKIKDKFLMVYRSSGLSGTGHEGQILPFMFLVSEPRFRETPGYIRKEMFYNSVFVSHHKNLRSFPEAQELMDFLREFLEDELPEVTEIEPTRENILKEASEINDSIREIIGINLQDKLLDLKTL